MTSQTLHRRNFLLHLQERGAYDGLVLLKEPAHEQLTGAQIGQLHNEYAISRQLDNVTGVRPAYTLEGSESHPVLLLKYIQGNNLAEIGQKQTLDIRQKLQLAVEISSILGRIHEAGVMHRDISSGNIMVADDIMPDEPHAVTIIDFGLATTLRQEDLAQPVASDVAAGTLAYISPEQTGRMNRAVDYRSDIYSLGVTLYELFTGQLPFEAADAMEMIHAHIAMQPIAPQQIDAEIPGVLSEIILILLAKNAEDRYQSLRGLGADLIRCLDQLQHKQTIESFTLREDDFSGRLQFPQKLYGRQAEIAQLTAAYDRVAEGNSELLFIAGYSGVGKTALVHEIRRDVLIKKGVFVEGKFDQLQHMFPYSAWAQVFTQLVNKWLTESETNLAGRRETILDAVGENGQILIDIIPDLERMIGPQPPVPQLGGIENQIRFNYTFNRFISSLATPEHPLVVFLDDLQWIDLASLNLIEALIAVQSASNLLIIGAYRDNEVGLAHPLLASQERMSAEKERVTIITLADLKPTDLDHFLADTLQTTAVECRELSHILVEKTAGNPFFFRQQLYALESEALLTFDSSQRRWTWEEDLHQSLQTGSNVVDLMISKIRTLPIETQQILRIAACLGNRYDISILSTISGQDQADILTALSPALHEGLINRTNGHFSFVHDRIQEAGYALIPEADRSQAHLKIGRLLQADRTAEKLDEEIFTIVGHLNAARTLIEVESEKLDLIDLNIKAGQKARVASAFSDAKTYIETGLDLLGSNSWQEQYDLTLLLHNENAELAVFTGQYDQITPMANLIHTNARNILDQVCIYMTKIEAATTQYDFNAAVGFGLDILGKLGTDIPLQPSSEDYQRLKEKYFDLLKNRPTGVINALTEMTDERALATSDILAAELTPTYIINREIYPIIGLIGANLTLEFGYNVWSPVFFAANGNIFWLGEDLGTPSEKVLDYLLFIRKMCEISLEMQQKPVYRRSQTRTLGQICVAGSYCLPANILIELAQTMFLSGFETGDLNYGGQGALHRSIYGLVFGKNLDTVRNQVTEELLLLKKFNQTTFATYILFFLQAAVNFIEPSEESHRLLGSHIDEKVYLSAAEAANDNTGMHFFYAVRLMLSYHFDEDNKLSELIGKAEKYIIAGPGLITVATIRIYAALSKLRLYPTLTSPNQEDALKIVDQCLRLMTIWSQSAPGTFQHLYDLIRAEKARVFGETDKALYHYEQAIQGAHEVNFINDEALANELFARFWVDRGNERFASQFMRESYSLYRKWGAMAKAEHLAKRYPNLLVSRRIISGESSAGTTSSQMFGDLDILTVLKASQAIAGAIELERLLYLLMTSAIENSGAQSGCLLLPEAGEWMIAAQADVDGAKPKVEQLVSMTESDPLSPAILNYVIRTQETVLLADAAQSGEFIDDPHIRQQEVKSLLCTPLVNQGKTSAILYLENNLSPGVFTAERVELLQLLSSQMAISIDNARTHEQLEQLLEERSIALSSAEAQIRSLFENSPVGIALSTYEGQILTVNKALLNMLRISEEDLLQQGVVDFYVDPADRKTILAELQESGSVQNFGVPLVRSDGELFYGSVNMSRLILEGNEVLLVMAEDVTDEITAEQELAAIEEREYLARELHDAVTQTLFSASVLAQASPRMIEKNPAIAKENFERLARLINGAMAEMRTLLLELRPSTIGDQSLSELFELLVSELRGQTNAHISLSIEANISPPDDVAIVFYRIARESLNNIVKHAMAGEVLISLSSDAESINLSIKDDGRGFDLRAIPAGHFGLSIMQERAKKYGADLNINSNIGEGTEVTAFWPAPGKENEHE